MVNLLRGIMTFLVLQNFLTAAVLYQSVAKRSGAKTEKPDNGGELYIVYTKNRFNQILIFKSRDEAADWLRESTQLSEDEIQAEIKTPLNIGGRVSVSAVD